MSLNGINRQLEMLERRVLLAGDLIARWQADSLNDVVGDSELVASWDDSVGGISSSAAGMPVLRKDAIGGRSAIEFDPSDGVDALTVPIVQNPMSGIGDFSVIVAFSTDSTSLVQRAVFAVPPGRNNSHSTQTSHLVVTKMPFLALKLVFRRRVQRKEERCPGKRLESLLTTTMYTILKSICNRKTLAACIIARAKMILLAFEKKSNSEIADAVGCERHCVGRWRRRWQGSWNALLAIEMHEPHAVFERAVMDTLRDAHRSGAPTKFSAEQVVQLVSMACENPRDSGRPVEDWTGRELADEMQKRSIVKSISTSRVSALLRLVNLQPHRRKYWCFTTEKDHELFQAQAQEVCRTYLEAPSACEHHNTRTICVDEMTSLQANELRAAKRRAKPSEIAKLECQYNRHGTLSLTGSWDVVKGQMIQTTISPTRDANDFAKHIEQTICADPDANWVAVMDNLNTHHGEPVVRLVARLLGIPQNTLGDKKKRRGILGSVKSRREFLTDKSHRIRFVFTPKHSSWLNQIEVIFGIIGNRVMRHGSFSSKEDLQDKLLSFIDYYNQTFAKPLQWTYTGKPTSAKADTRPRTWRENTQNTKLEKILALVA